MNAERIARRAAEIDDQNRRMTGLVIIIGIAIISAGLTTLILI